jgi:hypothetical protein
MPNRAESSASLIFSPLASQPLRLVHHLRQAVDGQPEVDRLALQR